MTTNDFDSAGEEALPRQSTVPLFEVPSRDCYWFISSDVPETSRVEQWIAETWYALKKIANILWEKRGEVKCHEGIPSFPRRTVATFIHCTIHQKQMDVDGREPFIQDETQHW